MAIRLRTLLRTAARPTNRNNLRELHALASQGRGWQRRVRVQGPKLYRNRLVYEVARLFSNGKSTDDYIRRLQDGELTEKELKDIIETNSELQKRLSKGGPSANSGVPEALAGYSRAHPIYMEQVNQNRFSSMLGSLAFWCCIIGVYIYFQRKMMEKAGPAGMGGGGMFDDNYSEYDEIHWEDDEVAEEKSSSLPSEPENTNPPSQSTMKMSSKPKTPIPQVGSTNPEDEELQEYHEKKGQWMGKVPGVSVSSSVPGEAQAVGQGLAVVDERVAKRKRKMKRTTFADVRGCDEAKTDLMDLVTYLKNPTDFKRLGCKLPKGVLLEGPPGTGKTLLARALAGEAKVPFLFTSGSSFDQVFVGVGVMRVKNLFKRAKELAPCIVFIDEVDAMAVSREQRGLQSNSSDSLNALLVEMDGFEDNNGVIVVAATNMAQKLDGALLRSGRFDRKVRVGLPDKKARKEIVDLYLKDNGDENVDSAKLVSDMSGFSGADLANLVNLAAIDAVKAESEKVTMEHLVEAKETIALGRARKSMQVLAKEKKLTAYHEGGHAIMALYTKGAMPIYKATLMPRGGALGMVSFSGKDENMKTRQALLADLDVGMGGRAAEELMYGEEYVTTGASNDFMQATNIATRMVTQFGMSSKLGKVFYTDEDLQKLSPAMQALINSEVKRLLDDSYMRAKTLLTKHKGKLESLAMALLEKETLSINQIHDVVKWNESDVESPKPGSYQYQTNLTSAAQTILNPLGMRPYVANTFANAYTNMFHTEPITRARMTHYV